MFLGWGETEDYWGANENREWETEIEEKRRKGGQEGAKGNFGQG